MTQQVIPSNYSPLEQAMARVSERWLDIPVPIRDLWDVDTCPVEFLPHLAAAYSVDFWKSDWTEAKKRSVIRNAVKHHRLKGTLNGMKAYANLADAEVLSVIRAPQRFYLGASRSAEERRTWLESLPQIRIYRSLPARPAGKRLFLGGKLRAAYLPRHYLGASLPASETGPKGVLIRNGVETVVGIYYDNQGYRTVNFRAPVLAGQFFNKRLGGFLKNENAGQRVARISADPASDNPEMAQPLRPAGTATGIYLRHEMIKQSIGRRVYFGSLLHRRVLAGRVHTASRVFETIPLADDFGAPEPSRAVSFFNHSRFAVQAHTAELQVSIPTKISRFAMVLDHSMFGTHLTEANTSRVKETMEALRSAKALADKVLINTTTYRLVLADQPIPPGAEILADHMMRI